MAKKDQEMVDLGVETAMDRLDTAVKALRCVNSLLKDCSTPEDVEKAHKRVAVIVEEALREIM